MQRAWPNMPRLIPGGRIDPTRTGIPPEIVPRLKKLQDDEEVLRRALYTKEDKLRKDLRAYRKMEAESSQWALRSDLSLRHLRKLEGEKENESQTVAF